LSFFWVFSSAKFIIILNKNKIPQSLYQKIENGTLAVSCFSKSMASNALENKGIKYIRVMP
jgi:hypothetical protein